MNIKRLGMAIIAFGIIAIFVGLSPGNVKAQEACVESAQYLCEPTFPVGAPIKNSCGDQGDVYGHAPEQNVAFCDWCGGTHGCVYYGWHEKTDGCTKCDHGSAAGIFIKPEVIGCDGLGKEGLTMQMYKGFNEVQKTCETGSDGKCLLINTNAWAAGGLGEFRIQAPDGFAPSNDLGYGCREGPNNDYWDCRTEDYNSSSGAVEDHFDFKETDCNPPRGYMSGDTTNLFDNQSRDFGYTTTDADGNLTSSAMYYRSKPKGSSDSNYSPWTLLSGSDWSFFPTDSFSLENIPYTCNETNPKDVQVVVNAYDAKGLKCTGNTNTPLPEGWYDCFGNAEWPDHKEFVCGPLPPPIPSCTLTLANQTKIVGDSFTATAIVATSNGAIINTVDFIRTSGGAVSPAILTDSNGSPYQATLNAASVGTSTYRAEAYINGGGSCEDTATYTVDPPGTCGPPNLTFSRDCVANNATLTWPAVTGATLYERQVDRNYTGTFTADETVSNSGLSQTFTTNIFDGNPLAARVRVIASSTCSVPGSWATQSLPACPVFQCTGLIPVGAERHDAEEEADLTADRAWEYSASDTITKCQYKCSDGYVRYNDQCVQPTCTVNLTDSDYEAAIGEVIIYSASVTDTVGGSIDEVVFSTDDSDVATVSLSSDGTPGSSSVTDDNPAYRTYVQGHEAGTARITARAYIGGYECNDNDSSNWRKDHEIF